MNRETEYYLGIDPGLSKTGFMLFRMSRPKGERVVASWDMSYLEALDWLQEKNSLSYWGRGEIELESYRLKIPLTDITVVIEDTRSLPVYTDKFLLASGRRKGDRSMAQAGRSIGQIDCIITTYVHLFGHTFEHVETITPRSKKWDKRLAAQALGFRGKPNNQHVRDAGRAVYDFAPHLILSHKNRF